MSDDITPEMATMIAQWSSWEQAARDVAALRADLAAARAERDEFHRILLLCEKGLADEGKAWVKAMTERDAARAECDDLRRQFEEYKAQCKKEKAI